MYNTISLVRSIGNRNFYTNYPKVEPQRLMKNIETKGQIAGNDQSLLFPQCEASL